jgi:ABC-type antimicrobial peptide transport system permease subunit
MFSAMIPGFQIHGGVAAQGLALACGLGLLAGLLPARRSQRLQPVTALRAEA